MKPVAQRWGVEGFRYWLQTQGHQPDTIRHYTTYAKQFIAWLESHQPDYLQASRYEVSAYLGEMATTRSPGTIDNIHGALRIFYDYLQDENLLQTENPARRVKRQHRVTRPTEAFTQLELKRLHDACRDFRERAVLMVLLGTMLRRSEILQVSREAINWESGTMAILGKGLKYRHIKLSPSVLEALQLALAFDEKLWPWTGATLWRMVHRLGKRAGIQGRIHPHRFRATGATEYLDAGATIEETQMALGHASVGMTLHYAQSGRERRALTRMSMIDLPARLLGTTT